MDNLQYCISEDLHVVRGFVNKDIYDTISIFVPCKFLLHLYRYQGIREELALPLKISSLTVNKHTHTAGKIAAKFKAGQLWWN